MSLEKHLMKKKDVHITFCDISKAFDRVWLEGLLFKLSHMGIKGPLYEWFRSYVTYRMQKVIIKGQSSHWGHITAGVPQGSVLGPLLFIAYINDLTEVVDCQIKIFADDTSLYVTVDTPEEAATQLNSNLERVRSWASQWLVNFNSSKTKAMTISNKKIVPPRVIFQNKIIEHVNEHKHLGLTFNNRLTWSNHINNIVKTVSKELDVLHKIASTIDRQSLDTVYKTFIRTKIEYACILWDNCYDYETDLLENCQLRAARIITGAKRGTSHEKLYKETKWPELKDRREMHKLCFMHKLVNETSPNYLIEILPNTKNVPYELRNISDVQQFTSRTEKFRKSLLPDCIRKWNALDDTIKMETSINKFRENITLDDKCIKWYYHGVRKFNVIHAQLRMECSNLRAHLCQLHVIDDPTCICSNAVEDNEHYFLNCPLYYVQRQKLFDTITPITELNIDIILNGTSELSYNNNIAIIDAVHEYIKESDRF